MRRFLARSSTIAPLLLVAAVAIGLSSMHVLPGLMTPERAGLLSRAAAPLQHHAGTHGGEMAEGATAGDADPASDSGHLHGLLDCVLFLVGSTIVVMAVAWAVRARRADDFVRGVLDRITVFVERSPPTSARLSLVGTARC